MCFGQGPSGRHGRTVSRGELAARLKSLKRAINSGLTLRFREQLIQRSSELVSVSLRDAMLPLVLDHNSASRRFKPTIPFGLPVSLSVWKNSKNTLPLAPSGIWAGKNSPRYLRFCAALPFE